MAKYAHPDVQDGYGAVIAAQCVRMAICTAAPSVYADIASTKVAEFTMSGADFTAGNGVTGRKLTIAAKSTPVTASATGTAAYVVLHDNSSKILFYQPPSNPQTVTSGNPVTMGEWDITLPTPT